MWAAVVAVLALLLQSCWIATGLTEDTKVVTSRALCPLDFERLTLSGPLTVELSDNHECFVRLFGGNLAPTSPVELACRPSLSALPIQMSVHKSTITCRTISAFVHLDIAAVGPHWLHIDNFVQGSVFLQDSAPFALISIAEQTDSAHKASRLQLDHLDRPIVVERGETLVVDLHGLRAPLFLAAADSDRGNMADANSRVTALSLSNKPIFSYSHVQIQHTCISFIGKESTDFLPMPRALNDSLLRQVLAERQFFDLPTRDDDCSIAWTTSAVPQMTYSYGHQLFVLNDTVVSLELEMTSDSATLMISKARGFASATFQKGHAELSISDSMSCKTNVVFAESPVMISLSDFGNTSITLPMERGRDEIHVRAGGQILMHDDGIFVASHPGAPLSKLHLESLDSLDELHFESERVVLPDHHHHDRQRRAVDDHRNEIVIDSVDPGRSFKLNIQHPTDVLITALGPGSEVHIAGSAQLTVTIGNNSFTSGAVVDVQGNFLRGDVLSIQVPAELDSGARMTTRSARDAVFSIGGLTVLATETDNLYVHFSGRGTFAAQSQPLQNSHLTVTSEEQCNFVGFAPASPFVLFNCRAKFNTLELDAMNAAVLGGPLSSLELDLAAGPVASVDFFGPCLSAGGMTNALSQSASLRPLSAFQTSLLSKFFKQPLPMCGVALLDITAITLKTNAPLIATPLLSSLSSSLRAVELLAPTVELRMCSGGLDENGKPTCTSQSQSFARSSTEFLAATLSSNNKLALTLAPNELETSTTSVLFGFAAGADVKMEDIEPAATFLTASQLPTASFDCGKQDVNADANADADAVESPARPLRLALMGGNDHEEMDSTVTVSSSQCSVSVAYRAAARPWHLQFNDQQRADLAITSTAFQHLLFSDATRGNSTFPFGRLHANLNTPLDVSLLDENVTIWQQAPLDLSILAGCKLQLHPETGAWRCAGNSRSSVFTPSTDCTFGAYQEAVDRQQQACTASATLVDMQQRQAFLHLSPKTIAGRKLREDPTLHMFCVSDGTSSSVVVAEESTTIALHDLPALAVVVMVILILLSILIAFFSSHPTVHLCQILFAGILLVALVPETRDLRSLSSASMSASVAQQIRRGATLTLFSDDCGSMHDDHIGYNISVFLFAVLSVVANLFIAAKLSKSHLSTFVQSALEALSMMMIAPSVLQAKTPFAIASGLLYVFKFLLFSTWFKERARLCWHQNFSLACLVIALLLIRIDTSTAAKSTIAIIFLWASSCADEFFTVRRAIFRTENRVVYQSTTPLRNITLVMSIAVSALLVLAFLLFIIIPQNSAATWVLLTWGVLCICRLFFAALATRSGDKVMAFSREGVPYNLPAAGNPLNPTRDQTIQSEVAERAACAALPQTASELQVMLADEDIHIRLSDSQV